MKEAYTVKEREAIFALRYKILRKPWNQSFESVSDELETSSTNLYMEDEQGNVIACGRLQENEHKTGQVRFMAIDDSYQGKGLGTLILQFLEKKAKSQGLVKIELQARENAVKFYESKGYSIKAPSFLLWGIIQHYLMEKSLEGQN